MRCLQAGRPVATGAGKRTFDVTEQIDFLQGLGNSRAIELCKGLAAVVLDLRNGVCHRFFAGSALAQDYDRSV